MSCCSHHGLGLSLEHRCYSDESSHLSCWNWFSEVAQCRLLRAVVKVRFNIGMLCFEVPSKSLFFLDLNCSQLVCLSLFLVFLYEQPLYYIIYLLRFGAVFRTCTSCFFYHFYFLWPLHFFIFSEAALRDIAVRISLGLRSAMLSSSKFMACS